jgi:hypothetical protein
MRIEDAVVETRLQSEVVAGIHERANHIGLVAAVGDV